MGGVAVLHPQDCLKDGLFVKSRRNPKPTTVNYSNSSPNLTRSDGRKRSPPTGVRRNNRTTAAVDPPSTAAPAVAKNLVMGQVKILKRGEPLVEEMNNEASSTTATATPPREDRKVVATGGRRVLPPPKKKVEKRSFSNPNPNPNNPKIDVVLRKDDFALSSTDRLGPDPDMVPKKKNIFFAGSAFVDSPPPSSVPLPGFCTKNFSAAVKDDRSSDLRRILGLSVS